MARVQRLYVCQSCGAGAPRWAGRCESCGEWNTIVEELPESAGVGGGPLKAAGHKGRVIELVSMAGETAEPPRLMSGIAEFDRVLGGGLVAGSAILIGGVSGYRQINALVAGHGRLWTQQGERRLHFR